jgi:hypothetical protein
MDLEQWHKSWRLIPCDDGLGGIECLGCNHVSPPWRAAAPFEHANGCQVAIGPDQFPWADLRLALAMPGVAIAKSALDGAR